MTDTKLEIIRSSVALFNKKGFFNVSIKDIADSMRISPGNFTYHFKRKEHLLSAILEEILNSSADIMPKGQYITLAHFEEMFRKFYAIQKQYSFFFLDIIYLMAEYPIILNGYRVATSRRFDDARRLVDHFIASGRLVEENNRVEYNTVIRNLWMVSTFWSTGTAIIDKKHALAFDDTPMTTLWGILSPYLTKKGYDEYEEIIQLNNLKSTNNL